MSESVIVTAAFVPVEGARDRLISALGRSISEVHGEKGCELYALHDVPDGTLLMIEKWSSVEDLDAHAAGDIVKRLDESIEDLITVPVVVTRMSAIPAGTKSQGQL